MAFLFDPEDKELLKKVYVFSKKRGIKLYLVGGYLRDAVLKRRKKNPDIDFCLSRNSISFGMSLSKKLKSGFVVLDKEHGSCRLVNKINKKSYTLDFTDFRGKGLEEDLLHRDFSINAIALELEKVFSFPDLDSCLIDPYHGRRDIKSRIIRTVNKKSFDEDPLRILRAFSLSAVFGFEIESRTYKLIALKRNKLSTVSSERIRDELFKILGTDGSFESFVKLDDLKILKIIFPEIEVMRGLEQGPYHHLDVLGHSLESLRQMEVLLRKFNKDKQMNDYLDEEICGSRTRRSLIKLGVLLHDIGKPAALRHEDGKTKFHGHERMGADITRNIVKRLKLSNDELSVLEKMVFWHLRPGYLADNEEISRRAIFRYFRDTGEEAASVLLISLADQRSTKGPLTTRKSRLRHEKVVSGLIGEYFRRKNEKKQERLVNGNDLIKKFKLAPSPLIGKILSEIEELQAIGKVKTKAGAFLAARKFLLRGR